MKNLVFVNSTKPGRKNFHGLNLTKPKMKCFVEFAVNIPPFVTKVADGSSWTGFHCKSLISHKPIPLLLF